MISAAGEPALSADKQTIVYEKIPVIEVRCYQSGNKKTLIHSGIKLGTFPTTKSRILLSVLSE